MFERIIRAAAENVKRLPQKMVFVLLIAVFSRINKNDSGFLLTSTKQLAKIEPKILRHADKYSKAFNRKTYDMILNHELSDEEIAKKQSGSSWYALPNEEPHIKMCKKTMYKQLLSDGRAPKSIREAIAIDSAPEKDGEAPILDAPNPISGALIDATPVDSLPDASESANFDAGETIDVPVSNFTPEAEKPSTAKKTASPAQESFFND